MPFRVPDDEEHDVESQHHPLTPPIRKPTACRSLDCGPGNLMPETTPYSKDVLASDQDRKEGFPAALQPRIQSLPSPSTTTSTTAAATLRSASRRMISKADGDDQSDEHQRRSEVPWSDTVEEVLRRIRKKHSRRRHTLTRKDAAAAAAQQRQGQQPEDGVPSSQNVEEDMPSVLEISLQALTKARVFLDQKNEYDDDKRDFGGGFPSLQPLDVQVVPEEKDQSTHPLSPVSIPGAHRVSGPSDTPLKSNLRPVAVAVDWTNQLPPPPPVLDQQHLERGNGATDQNEFEVIHPQYGQSPNFRDRVGSMTSELSRSTRRFPSQPLQQNVQTGQHHPHWVYVPSSSSLSSQMAVDNANRTIANERSHSRVAQNNMSTSAVVPPLFNGRSHRFRNTSLVAPSFFDFPFQLRATPNALPASTRQRQVQNTPERPLEATVVRDDLNLTLAEPVWMARSSPLRLSGTRRYQPHVTRQCQTSQELSPRGRQFSSSSEDTELMANSSASYKTRRMVALLVGACLAILIVIILVLAMLLYHSLSSSSQSSHIQVSSPPPSTGSNTTPAYTWQPVFDCGQITGTSVALSYDGGVLVTARSTAVNGTTSVSVVNAYLMNGKQCIQLGDTIQAGVAPIHTLPVPPLALSSDGYTLAVGTTSTNNTGGQISMYTFTNSSWNQWGEAITAWTSTNTSGGIWGWSVAMSSNGLRLATGIVEQGAHGGRRRGYVQIFQYTVEEQQWSPMGFTLNSQGADNLTAWSVHLSADGKILAVGAMSRNTDGSGILRVNAYQWNQAEWYPMGATFVGVYDLITSGGDPLALSDDGQTLAHSMAGRVQIYRFNGTEWNQLGSNLYGNNALSTMTTSLSGVSLAFGDSGKRLAVGMPQSGEAGVVGIFQYNEYQNDWVSIGNLTTAPFGDEYFGTRVALNVASGAILAAGSENAAGDGSGHVLLYSSSQVS